jgi:hypothetical protein
MSDDNEKSGKIIHFEKIGSNFFWTPSPPMTILFPTFWVESLVRPNSRMARHPIWKNWTQFFQNELFFRFSETPKSMFLWFIRSGKHGKVNSFFIEYSAGYL